MKKDSRGIALTGASEIALARYETRSSSSRRMSGDPDRDDRRGAARSARVRRRAPLQGAGALHARERRFAAMAKEALDAARAHLSSASDRERGCSLAATPWW
jgi:hypothetical protein